jgi:hypothetical protein
MGTHRILLTHPHSAGRRVTDRRRLVLVFGLHGGAVGRQNSGRATSGMHRRMMGVVVKHAGHRIMRMSESVALRKRKFE